MRQMRAAGIDAFGDAVRMLDLSPPSAPAPDEVVISVRAAGVGNWDEIVRVGDWDVGHRPPLALGVEAAGIVDAVGEDRKQARQQPLAGLRSGNDETDHDAQKHREAKAARVAPRHAGRGKFQAQVLGRCEQPDDVRTPKLFGQGIAFAGGNDDGGNHFNSCRL